MNDLPPGWARVALGDVGTWFGGGTPSKAKIDFWENGTIPWISPKDMGSDIISDTRNHISPAALSQSAVRLVPAGSVAIVVRSGILERKLPVTVVPFATTLNQDMRAVCPFQSIEPKWIAWALRFKQQDILRYCRKGGTTVASIEVPRLMDLAIPIPPLAEQRRIVAVLEDHLSRLNAAQSYINHAGGLAAALRQSLRAAAVLGGQRVKPSDSLDPGWTWGKLGDVISGIEAGKSFTCEPRRAEENEWGVIKVSAMTWGEFREEENKAVPPSKKIDARHEIRPGDILVSRANTENYVGAPVLVRSCREKLLLSDKSLRIIPKARINREWLVQVLASPLSRSQISAKATGNQDSMRNISQRALREIRIPIPPEPDQAELAGRLRDQVRDVDFQVKQVDLIQRQAEALRRSLLAEAFAGRLVPQDPGDEPASVLLEKVQAERAARAGARRNVRLAANTAGQEMLL